MTKRFLREEHGQSIVLITLVMIGLVAVAGLVFDGGNAYLQRRKIQNAADAGAMAGARKLALSVNKDALTECDVLTAALTYAKANGAPVGSTACGVANDKIHVYFINKSGAQTGVELPNNSGVPSGAAGVKVAAQTTFSTFFLGVVSQSEGGVAASANAAFEKLSSPDTLQPMARKCIGSELKDCGFEYNQSYQIWGNVPGAGNFAWLTWNGDPNAQYLQAELDPNSTTLNGYIDPGGTGCSKISIACWVQGLTGVDNSIETRNLLDYWKAQGALGKPLTIVIWDTDNLVTQGAGSHYNYHIKGFASFILESYDLPQKSIIGKFIKWVTAGELCTGNCMDTGTTAVHLTQ